MALPIVNVTFVVIVTFVVVVCFVVLLCFGTWTYKKRRGFSELFNIYSTIIPQYSIILHITPQYSNILSMAYRALMRLIPLNKALIFARTIVR